VNREAVVLIGVTAIALGWLFRFEPGPVPARAWTIRGDAQATIIAFGVSPDRTTIATACADGRVSLRHSADGWSLRRPLGDRGLVWALAFAPDGRSLTLVGDGPDVTVCDIGAEGAGRALRIPIRRARALAFSPDGRILAATSEPTDQIILWDLLANRERTRLRGHPSQAISLAFSPDGRTLASGAYGDRSIIVWDLATGVQRACLAATPGPATSSALAFSPDGTLLASASRFEGSVRIWGRAGHVVRVLACHSYGLRSLAFSPDGRRLATADNDGTAKLWSVAAGRLLASLDSHAEWLWGVAFSPDGRTLAAVGSGDDLRLCDLTEIRGNTGR
jgi:WD40 repeat protein